MGLVCRVRFEGAALSRRAEAAAQTALRAAGEDIRRRANALAPRRTGAMIASSRVELSGQKARVSYGAPYARIQHEATGFHHPRGGQAKYLADAVDGGEAARVMRDAFRVTG